MSLPLNDWLPSDLVRLACRLEEEGHWSFVAGHVVRDALVRQSADDGAPPCPVSEPAGSGICRSGVSVDRGPTASLIVPREAASWIGELRQPWSSTNHQIKFHLVDNVEQFIASQSFTIEAIAWSPAGERLVDPVGGAEDLVHGRTLRCVTEPCRAFKEDPSRILRAYRLLATHDLELEAETARGMVSSIERLSTLEAPQVRDELLRMMEEVPAGQGRMIRAFRLMEAQGFLALALPELLPCRGVTQPPEFHRHDVLDHLYYSADCTDRHVPLHRLGMLLHDIGKPESRQEEAGRITFIGHENTGARIADQLLRRLDFAPEDRDTVVELVQYHMRLHDFWAFGDRGLRRLRDKLQHLSLEDLVYVRFWDRLGAGMQSKSSTEKARDDMLNRLDRLRSEPEIRKEASPALAVDGRILMETLGVPGGKGMGEVIRRLEAVVAESPELNHEASLLEMAQEFFEMGQRDGQRGHIGERGVFGKVNP